MILGTASQGSMESMHCHRSRPGIQRGQGSKNGAGTCLVEPGLARYVQVETGFPRSRLLTVYRFLS